MSQTEWLRTTEHIDSQFWKLEVCNQVVGRLMLPLKSVEESLASDGSLTILGSPWLAVT